PENKPVQLRLFLLESSSTTATMEQFSNALAYYERPGRAELIRSVVNRYLSHRVDAAPPEPAELIEHPHSVSSNAAQLRLRHARRVVVAALLMVSAAA